MTDMEKVGKLLKQKKGCSNCKNSEYVKSRFRCSLEPKMGVSVDFVCCDFKE